SLSKNACAPASASVCRRIPPAKSSPEAASPCSSAPRTGRVYPTQTRSRLFLRCFPNAARVQVEENILRFANLPEAFDGFTILHISDMHVDISEEAMRQLAE